MRFHTVFAPHSRRYDQLSKSRHRTRAALPEGAFYVMPKTPIEDDARFVTLLAEEGVFCLPGHVFQMPGYLRASVTANDEMIERALPKFAAVHNPIAPPLQHIHVQGKRF